MEPDHLKLLAEIKKLQTLVGLLVYKKDHSNWQTDAVGQVVETRETDGSVSEFTFADEQACGCSQKNYYESLIEEEERLLGPKKKRSYDWRPEAK